MNKYDVNFKRLALLILPTFWRKPILAAFVYASVSSLSSLHTKFMSFRQTSNYRLTHNGQVCYLRSVLNDKFDPLDRRITITETDRIDALLLYARELNKPVRILRRADGRGVIINRRGYAGTNNSDFWVNIPGDLFGKIDIERLKAIVDTYKLASKRFSINYI